MVHLVVSLFNGADVTARCKRKIPPFCALEQYVINEPELLQFHYLADVGEVHLPMTVCFPH